MKKLISVLILLTLLVGILHHLIFGCIPKGKKVPPIIHTTSHQMEECNISNFIVKSDVTRYRLFCLSRRLDT